MLLFPLSTLLSLTYLIPTIICEYSYWQNGEAPIIFNDAPTVQERTNFPFHNVQFESNYPWQQRGFVEIPLREKPIADEGQQTIGDKIKSMLPDPEEKERVLDIVDASYFRNKSLLQKITELSQILSKNPNTHGIEQSELFHGMVETDRKRQGALRQLQHSLNPEFKNVAEQFMNIERNFTLSDIQKQAEHDGILGSLASTAKTALKDFESFLKSSSRSRRQLREDPDWNMRSNIYMKPDDERAMIPPLPTLTPSNNGYFADMLTKNRFQMPTPVDRAPSFPPKGFFPNEPTKPPGAYDVLEGFPIPGFGPPRPVLLTTTTPEPFGVDLSEISEDPAFVERNKMFRKHRYRDSGRQLPTVWIDQTQALEKAQRTVTHYQTPISPNLSRNELVVQSKVETEKVPVGTQADFAQQTISQSSLPVLADPPRSQVITQSHIETVRTPVTGTSYGTSAGIPSIDVKVSPSAMISIESSGGALVSGQTTGAIGRFDTNIGRYDTGEGRQKISIQIPDSALANLQPQGSAGMIPSQPMGYRPSPYGSNTGLPRGYVPSNEPLMPPSYLNPPPGAFIPSGYEPRPSSVGSADLKVNTRILTNDQFKPAIIPEPNTVVLKETSLEANNLPTTAEPPLFTTAPTYPDFSDDLFPIPLNQAKADNRPVGGTYIRRQDMFGGGTNEYRQDNGRISEKIDKAINDQRHWPSAVDDRRRKGYIDPEVRYGPDERPISIENQPLPPYGGTSRAEKKPGHMEGDDLSVSDPYGGRSYFRTDTIFTTAVPWNLETTAIVKIPSIDIDPRLDFPGNRAARPTEKEIIWNRLAEDARKPPEKGQILPYFGPEEITRSRYINANPPENNIRDGRRHQYVKIDLPNTSTIS